MLTAKRYANADAVHAGTDFEGSDRFLGHTIDGLLAGNLAQSVDDYLVVVLVVFVLADTDIQDDFLEARYLVWILEPKFFLETSNQLLGVEALQTWCRLRGSFSSHYLSSLLFAALATRTLVPSFLTIYPTRVI